MLEAEIVATGDELMSGAVQDSNTALICARLRENGVRVRRSTMVGDLQTDIETALREASSRAPIVVCTGGLGPTEDDRTTAAAANVAGKRLVRDEKVLDHIRGLFARFGRPMTPNNEKQADFPEGSEVLDNPVGTACGFAMDVGKARAFFTPGVPREFVKMLEEQILPRIRTMREKSGDARKLGLRVVKSYGHGESQVETMLAGIEWPKEITVGYRAKYPEIHLRLYAEGENVEAALAFGEKAIRERLGPAVFGIDSDTMASTLGRLLTERGWSIAIAESCTGGMIGAAITEVPGSSAWFDRGFVTYSNESKTKELGVPEAMLKEHGAVSEPVVRALAEGARRESGKPIAISVTGIAGPDGGTPDKPVGTVWIACALEGVTHARLLKLVGDRERIRLGATWSAMDLARRALLGVLSDPSDKKKA